jgi:asparagine synthase (glutamine-hydrolysing)
VLIGDYFAHRGGACVRPEGDPLRQGRRLLAEGWGAYVALFTDAGGLSVLNDPSGAWPAYAWTLRGVCAVSDDVVRLPAGFAPANLALDWDAITELLRSPYRAQHLSPLAGYAAVAPGELRHVAAGRSEFLWRPGDFAAGAGDPEGEGLYGAVLSAVDRLASVEPRLLVEVSGGLDSAIVAGALAATGHGGRVAAAVHSQAAAAEGDERAWAQAVCDAHGLPLVCAPMAAEPLAIADYEAHARHVAPAFGALDAPRDRALEALARETDGGAIFGGQGGDAVFYQMPTAAVVADYLRQAGPAGALHRFPRQVARRLRRSLWSVLAEARRPRAWVGAGREASRRLWGRRARETPPGAPHPWLVELAAAAPGKQVQIAALLGTHEAWNRTRRASAAAVVQPLLAQPVVEAALATPAWRLLEGGRDRALARKLFAALLPPQVAARRSKGTVATLYAERMARSLDVVRPYLLDGVLVDAEVLDRTALDAVLTPEVLLWDAEGARLGRALMTEAWVRHWQGRAPDLARAARRPR